MQTVRFKRPFRLHACRVDALVDTQGKRRMQDVTETISTVQDLIQFVTDMHMGKIVLRTPLGAQLFLIMADWIGALDTGTTDG